MQNARGKSLAAVFTARAKPGATVSMPLVWDDVNASLDPKNFTIRNAIERLERMGNDPVRPVIDEKPNLARVLENLAELWSQQSPKIT
jgi:bifunctional non-homologous end joining protein LigD